MKEFRELTKDKFGLLKNKEYYFISYASGGAMGMPGEIQVITADGNAFSCKDYSPTTMYNDYSINEELFHWQSQSTTSDTSPTGQRYINHVREGGKVLLFVREFKKDMAGAAPYTYLGTARYVSHYGSRPMSITWHLDNPIPAKYIKKTSKLEVG